MPFALRAVCRLGVADALGGGPRAIADMWQYFAAHPDKSAEFGAAMSGATGLELDPTGGERMHRKG